MLLKISMFKHKTKFLSGSIHKFILGGSMKTKWMIIIILLVLAAILGYAWYSGMLVF